MIRVGGVVVDGLDKGAWFVTPKADVASAAADESKTSDIAAVVDAFKEG